MAILLRSLNTGVLPAPAVVQIVPFGNYIVTTLTYGVAFVINGTGAAAQVVLNITRSNTANLILQTDLLVPAGNTLNPQPVISIPIDFVVPRGERILLDYPGAAGTQVIAVFNIYGESLP